MCVDSVEKERTEGAGQRKAENDLITYIEYILAIWLFFDEQTL